jgi:hypothetical protein
MLQNSNHLLEHLRILGTITAYKTPRTFHQTILPAYITLSLSAAFQE